MMAKPNLNSLPPEDLRKLVAAMNELKSRGVEIPAGLLNPDARIWPLDENGFFTKADGRHYSLEFIDSEGHQQTAEGKKAFIESKARFVGLFGGRGSGKSGAGSQKAIRKIMAGESGAVINPDFENFRYSTWPEFREWLPWGMVIPSQRHRRSAAWQPRQPFVMVFLNGAKVYCKGLKNPDSARGPNLNWLWYDEASRDETGLAWHIAIASVRVGKDPTAFATFTPRGMEHWTYKFFVQREIPEEVLKLLPPDTVLTEGYYTNIEENKGNLDPGYYASMLAAYPTGWLRDQELYGKFVEEGGVLGDPEWFRGKILPEPLPLYQLKKRIRYWDLAATEKNKKNKDPDSTTGTLYSWDGADRSFIEDQIAEQLRWENLKTLLVEVARIDGPFVEIWIEQEPGAGGKNQIAEIASLPALSGYVVKEHIPEGDKVQRANVWFADAALGKVYLVKGPWNAPFLSQLGSFPQARHDDRIDGVSGARQVVHPIRKWRRTAFLSLSKSSLDALRKRREEEAKLQAATREVDPDTTPKPSTSGIMRL